MKSQKVITLHLLPRKGVTDVSDELKNFTADGWFIKSVSTCTDKVAGVNTLFYTFLLEKGD